MTTIGFRIGLGRGCCAGAITALLVGSGPLLPRLAIAALGEPETGIPAEAQQQRASLKSTMRANYRVHEIRLPSGTVLREFATVGGSVFAIAWSGPMMPDLRQALGQYFDAYVSSAQAARNSRHHFQVTQNDLVIQSGGHMRSFSGRAYLPKAVPDGVSVDELH